MERVGGLSPHEKRMGEETCTQSVEKRVGQKGSDYASSFEVERREDADKVGKYRTGTLLLGIMLQVAVTFLSFRVCFHTEPHVFPCFPG